jgi:amino acid adenylation domain-containing protein
MTLLPSAAPGKSFHELFEEQAARTPNATAVRAENGSLTYSELNRRANQLAHLLRELGVGPEVPVGVCMEPSRQLVVAVLGILKAAGAYVPVDPHDPADRKDLILRDADTSVVVVTATAARRLRADASRRIVELDDRGASLEGRPTEDEPSRASGLSHAAYLLYTSGSTGRPKGVVVENRQLVSYTFAIMRRFGIDGPLRYAMVQPLAVDSSITALTPPLCTGGETHLLSRETALNADRLADWFSTQHVDCLKIAPSHLRALQSSPRFTDLFPRRLLVVGGEASDWRWLRDLQRLAPPRCRVFNHYGPTETTVGVLTLAVDEHLDAEWNTCPIGVPLPNTRAYVVDGAGQPVPTGVAGELLIGGDNVARGYYGREDLTAAAFQPDTLSGRPGGRVYRTGDIARRLAGGLIEFLGRVDDQIKVRGFRVELGEIDAALQSHPGVRHAAAIVREDVPGDRRIVAYVEPHTAESFSTAELERQLRQRLPSHMIPRALVAMDALPLSGHGKIDRVALPPPRVPDDNGCVSAQRPQSGLEYRVAGVWKELLHTDAVGIEENFFDIGGHSLLLVELHHRLQAVASWEFDPLKLFQHTTVRAQAEFLSRREQGTTLTAGRTSKPQRNALLKHRQKQLRAKRGRRG